MTVQAVAGHRTFTTATHTSPARGFKKVIVKSSAGEQCQIDIDIETGAIKNVRGHNEPFKHWLNHIYEATP